MSDLHDFLENIRKYSPKIGEVAMRHVSCIELICLLSRKTSFNHLFLILKTFEELSNEAEIIGRKKKRVHVNRQFENEEEELSAQDLMDFSPVYRCMHIYTVLKELETFKTYYRQQRQQQARLVLQPPINMVNFQLSSFFFLVIMNFNKWLLLFSTRVSLATKVTFMG